MQTTLLRYNVVIRKEGRNYIADVPTLGISDFGRTLESAQSNVRSAILCHIEGLQKTKTPVPSPDTNSLTVASAEISFPGSVQFAV